MSLLVVQLPQRQRLHPHNPPGSDRSESAGGREYEYVTSPDGLSVQRQGRSAASLLPGATQVVAVLADVDVSWHRITLPKASAARMRAALEGVLEENLLDDADAIHLALAPQAVPGQKTWVAAVDRRWLRGELAALEKANVFVDRVVPMSWPDEPPIGHFSEALSDTAGPNRGVVLTWANSHGVLSLRLDGGLARAMLPASLPESTRWSTSPAAASAAEQWLGTRVNVLPSSHRALQAGRSLWNLRQFDLVRRTRGARALRDALRQLLSPAWRPVRAGVAALLVAQVVGLNLWAWQQRTTLQDKRAAIASLIKATFPGVSEFDIARDANAVVQRETSALRTMAGRPGDADLEPLLQAAASAWPADRPPAENLRFEAGKLTVGASGWSAAQIEHFRSLLRPAGWAVEATQGRLTIGRTQGTAAS
ncbi:MAG: type II secretion system protein GspL [Burkholderiaceae bacterium]